MILDKGICTIFRAHDLSLAGEMPRPGYEVISRGWYGEINFETSPATPTDGRRELEVSARIRVLQDRAIRQDDVVLLREVTDWREVDPGEEVYRITRAYHGTDDDGPTPITDLSLEVFVP